MGCFDSGGSKTESTTTSETKTKAQKRGLKKALKLYKPELGKNENVWQGERVTPFSTLQQGAMAGVGNYSDLFSNPLSAGTPLFDETGTAIKGLMGGEFGAQKLSDQDVSEYFKAKHYDPAMTTLREDINPAIDEAYAGPGFFASGRSHERVEASMDVADRLAEERGQLEWDVLGRNQALDEARAGRTQAAVPQAMAYGQVPAQEIQNNLKIAAQQIGGLGTIFGIGAAEQTQGQRELEAEITKFAQENQITDPENLSILLTLLGMNFSRSQSSSSGSGWGPGLGYAGTTGFFEGLGKGMATPST